MQAFITIDNFSFLPVFIPKVLEGAGLDGQDIGSPDAANVVMVGLDGQGLSGSVTVGDLKELSGTFNYKTHQQMIFMLGPVDERQRVWI